MSIVRNFFTPDEKKRITKAIEAAEKQTSGEIRVHLENKCGVDMMNRAAYLFAKLDMHKTEKRNGVLFYLAVADKKFAILGDAGINSLVPKNFWDNIKEEMQKLFKQGDFTDGLEKGINMTGEALKKFFPYANDDVNELSDEISFG